ncbi:MAG TPA: zinc ABC transporter permease subunit ZnuB [Alcanivoracaceae bacterium]|nr:zinc ABC transporter permease subunit ZnuB [Alcanivoracaceae bacterium]
MIELLLPALLAGLAIALVAGPMGSFVVWRRMAFFGDTLAHGSLLGAAFGLAVGMSLYPAVIVCCVVLALVLTALQQQRFIANDTLLGIVAHTTLALGIVALSLLPGVKVDLFGFLFGDLLAVSMREAAFLWAGAAFIFVVLALNWRHLLSITVNEELARVEGVPVTLARTLLMVLLALLIAGALRTVGVLLITSLLVIPPAAARRFSSTPEKMAALASVLGACSVAGGLTMSWFADTPVGPSIVIAAAGLFILSLLIPARQ